MKRRAFDILMAVAALLPPQPVRALLPGRRNVAFRWMWWTGPVRPG